MSAFLVAVCSVSENPAVEGPQGDPGLASPTEWTH